MTAPDKHPCFTVYSRQPLNGGVPLPLLIEHAITPTDRFFVRNHADIPSIDPTGYRLSVSGLVDRPLYFSLDDLRRFKRVTIEATLQCAGNRRSELIAVAPIPGELPWNEEAIGHARWSGVRLADLLEEAGVDPAASYVAFVGSDQVERQGRTFGYGGSIAIPKALSSDVLLADQMNDAPLLPAHGAPLRVIVPGYIGARSVKWLHAITLQREPSDNYFQRRAYRLFAPSDRAETVNWECGLMLNESSINAVICEPQPNSSLTTGSVAVRGYAIAGGERTVARVDLSVDGGTTWQTARLEGAPQPYVWQHWHAMINLAPGAHELVVRAFDSAANTQPCDPREVWNFKGYMNNAWHRVRIHVDPH